MVLTDEEIRVLGSLLEKEMTTPEYYPLTLNALVNACNQKTSRFPVVSYGEELVLDAIEALKEKRLVWQGDSGRVPRYEELFVKNDSLIPSEAAALCTLMLRGPQTPGEIKSHTDRLYQFPDLEKTEEALSSLVEAGYAVKLTRLPGRKEARYAHLLAGTPSDIEAPGMNAPQPSVGPGRDRDARIAELEGELSELRREFDEFRLKVAQFMEQFS